MNFSATIKDLPVSFSMKDCVLLQSLLYYCFHNRFNYTQSEVGEFAEHYDGYFTIFYNEGKLSYALWSGSRNGGNIKDRSLTYFIKDSLKRLGVGASSFRLPLIFMAANIKDNPYNSPHIKLGERDITMKEVSAFLSRIMKPGKALNPCDEVIYNEMLNKMEKIRARYDEAFEKYDKRYNFFKADTTSYYNHCVKTNRKYINEVKKVLLPVMKMMQTA